MNNDESIYKLMFTEYPDVVTVPQLQSMLHISRQLAYELINEGKLKALRVGNSYRITKISVIDFISKE